MKQKLKIFLQKPSVFFLILAQSASASLVVGRKEHPATSAFFFRVFYQGLTATPEINQAVNP